MLQSAMSPCTSRQSLIRLMLQKPWESRPASIIPFILRSDAAVNCTLSKVPPRTLSLNISSNRLIKSAYSPAYMISSTRTFSPILVSLSATTHVCKILTSCYVSQRPENRCTYCWWCSYRRNCCSRRDRRTRFLHWWSYRW
jgi:hypothetical protein